MDLRLDRFSTWWCDGKKIAACYVAWSVIHISNESKISSSLRSSEDTSNVICVRAIYPLTRASKQKAQRLAIEIVSGVNKATTTPQELLLVCLVERLVFYSGAKALHQMSSSVTMSPDIKTSQQPGLIRCSISPEQTARVEHHNYYTITLDSACHSSPHHTMAHSCTMRTIALRQLSRRFKQALIATPISRRVSLPCSCTDGR